MPENEELRIVRRIPPARNEAVRHVVVDQE